MVVATLYDLTNYLADPSSRAATLAYLQALLDEQYGYNKAGIWTLVGGGGLGRLGLSRAEAVALGGVDRVAEEPAGVTLPEFQAARKVDVAVLRNQRRARGVLFGAARLAAMPEDQGTYGDSITYLSWKPQGTRIKWKAATGWIEVDLPTLRAAAETVGDFIEALFDAEHAHHIAIDALTSVEAVRAYDITTGWPE